MTKAKETKKQRFKPWNKLAKADLEHSLLQIEKDLLLKKQSVHILEIGQIDLDKEIEGYIGEAQLELKKARLSLDKMVFDKANNITKKETLFALNEAKREVKRLQQNFNAISQQIKDGQPILEDLNTNKEGPMVIPPGGPVEPDAVNKHKHEGAVELHPVNQIHADKIAREAHNKLMTKDEPDAVNKKELSEEDKKAQKECADKEEEKKEVNPDMGGQENPPAT